jgi:hypothetical protein
MTDPVVAARRGGAPATAAATAMPWAHQGGATENRATTRARRMVEGLPGWEPLPPGELLVRRPTSS